MIRSEANFFESLSLERLITTTESIYCHDKCYYGKFLGLIFAL